MKREGFRHVMLLSCILVLYGCAMTVTPNSMAVGVGVPVVVGDGYAPYPPIVEGEPMYLVPPIAFAGFYDYWTFRYYGPYIDIVFMSGGHEVHRSAWYDERGRRMNRESYESWRYERPHQQRVANIDHHRRIQRDRHNINHDDRHFGIKRTPASQPRDGMKGPGAVQQRQEQPVQRQPMIQQRQEQPVQRQPMIQRQKVQKRTVPKKRQVIRQKGEQPQWQEHRR